MWSREGSSYVVSKCVTLCTYLQRVARLFHLLALIYKQCTRATNYNQSLIIAVLKNLTNVAK